jgi:hypothetical protein
MEFLYNNWLAILGLLSAPIAYIFGGKQKQNVELKKSNSDAVASMQAVYDQFLTDYRARMDEVMAELKESKLNYIELQKQFNAIHLSYSKEVEVSQNWEKLHRELDKKYKELEKSHETLKKDHELLRKEFLNYKKKDASSKER